MRTFLEIFRDVVIIATGIAGTVFGVYKYRKSREAEGVLEVELEADVSQYDGKNLIDVSIKIKNVGKSAAFISPESCKRCLLKVRKVICPKGDHYIGWENLDQKVVDDVGFMEIYPRDYPDEPLIFEPNTSEAFKVFFSTEYSGPIWIRSEVEDRDEYCWVTNKLMILPEPARRQTDG